MSNKIVVTGGNGFLGRHVVDCLSVKHKQSNVYVIRSKDYDLSIQSHVQRMYEDLKPNMVIHLAAVVGGIGANKSNPGLYYYKNMSMGLHLIEEARMFGLDKFVAVGTVCAYPKHTPVPFREDHIWDGYPEETNAPYGLAKKMMLVQSQAYREQYDFNSIYLLPVNLYGPGDNFDLQSSHVIPAIIRKMVDAKIAKCDNVILWGDGSASREFLYVKDAADAICKASFEYNSSEPLNIGTGREVLIKDLVVMIKEMCGYEGDVVWDIEKPNGQPRRCLDTSKAEIALGWKAPTDLEEGLMETIKWYKANPSER